MFGQKTPFMMSSLLPGANIEHAQQNIGRGHVGVGSLGGIQGGNNPYALRAQYQSAQGDMAMADKLLEAGYVPNSGALGALAMVASAYAGKKLKKGAEDKISDVMSKMFEEDSIREQKAIQAKQQQADLDFQKELAKISYTQQEKAKHASKQGPKAYKVGNELVVLNENGEPEVKYTGKASGGGAPAPLADARFLSWYESLSPEQRALYDQGKGRNKKGVTVYDPNTGQPIMEMGGGSGELGKPVQNKLQTDILDAENTLANLEAAGGKFSEDYLTLGGKAKAAAGATLDKLGLPDIGGAKEFNAKRSTLIQDVDQFFQEYRRYITGAAAAQREIEDLKKASLDSSLGPTEFMSRYSNLMNKMRSEVDRKKQQLNQGIRPAQPQQQPPTQQVAPASRDDLLNMYLR